MVRKRSFSAFPKSIPLQQINTNLKKYRLLIELNYPQKRKLSFVNFFFLMYP